MHTKPPHAKHSLGIGRQSYLRAIETQRLNKRICILAKLDSTKKLQKGGRTWPLGPPFLTTIMIKVIIMKYV